MHFATAGIDVAFWLPPLVAFAISLVTSTGGISGAFLLLPFQVSVLGFTSPAVSATNHLYNVVAIPAGLWRFRREGRLAWPLVAVVLAGAVPGVIAGTYLRVRFLPEPQRFRLLVAVVLGFLGWRLSRAALARGRDATAEPVQRVSGVRLGLRRLEIDYGTRRLRVSVPVLGGFCLVVGVVGGAYGMGGGSLVAPFLVTVLGLPVHLVAGAALAGTMTTSLVAVAGFQVLAPYFPHLAVSPDWALGALFGLGGLAGIYCGARLQKFVPARLIKGLLALIVVATAVRYLVVALPHLLG